MHLPPTIKYSRLYLSLNFTVIFMKNISNVLTNYMQVTELCLRSYGVDLAHISSSILFLHIVDV